MLGIGNFKLCRSAHDLCPSSTVSPHKYVAIDLSNGAAFAHMVHIYFVTWWVLASLAQLGCA